MNSSIQIVLPSGALGPDSRAYLIEAVIRAIAEHHQQEGEHAVKYGTAIDTELFTMQPYCWCEGESCPYCRAEAKAPNFHYKPTDLKVWWYKYIGRGMEFSRDASIDECAKILANCISAKRSAPNPAK